MINIGNIATGKRKKEQNFFPLFRDALPFCPSDPASVIGL